MKRNLYSLLVATAFDTVLADASKSQNVKVTLVYRALRPRYFPHLYSEHELPNVPGKSIKGALLEYGPTPFVRRYCVARKCGTPMHELPLL